jgi:hypothetical protein
LPIHFTRSAIVDLAVPAVAYVLRLAIFVGSLEIPEDHVADIRDAWVAVIAVLIIPVAVAPYLSAPWREHEQNQNGQQYLLQHC